jgi:hypothetical protein
VVEKPSRRRRSTGRQEVVDRSTDDPNLDLRERWRGEKGKGKVGILGLNGNDLIG